MRTFQMYSLSNFQICKTVLTIVTMLYISSPGLIYTWKFLPFDPLHPFLPSLPPPPQKIFALLKDYPFPQKDWEPLLYNVISGGLQEICHNLRCRVKKSTLIFILIAKYLVTKYQKRKYSIQKQ